MLDLGRNEERGLMVWEKGVHGTLICHLSNINLPDPVPSHLPFGLVRGPSWTVFPPSPFAPPGGTAGWERRTAVRTQEKPCLLPPETRYLPHPSRLPRRGLFAPGRLEAIGAAALRKPSSPCCVLCRIDSWDPGLCPSCYPHSTKGKPGACTCAPWPSRPHPASLGLCLLWCKHPFHFAVVFLGLPLC